MRVLLGLLIFSIILLLLTCCVCVIIITLNVVEEDNVVNRGIEKLFKGERNDNRRN